MKFVICILILCFYLGSGQYPNTCNFSYNGYNFDLNGMYLPVSQGDYLGTDLYHPTYSYTMNVCGPSNVGGTCSDTGGILCQFDTPGFVAVVAYQFATPVPQWTVLSPSNPNMGVTMTVSNGALCYPTNDVRNVTMIINCDPDAPMDLPFTVYEDTTNACSYHLDLTHPGACPLPDNLIPLTSGFTTAPASLNTNAWSYYSIYVPANSQGLSQYGELMVTLRQQSDNVGYVGLWIRRGAPPTRSSFDRYDNTPGTQYHSVEIGLADSGSPLVSGTWYIGVQAQNSLVTSFTVRADLLYCPGNCSGNGVCSTQTRVCTCAAGYVNNQPDCSAPTIDASLNVTYAGGVFNAAWAFYRVQVTDSMADELLVTMTRNTRTPASLPILAIKYNDYPTATYYDAMIRDYTTPSQNWALSINFPVVGTWIIGIGGSPDQWFNYTTTFEICDCPKCCSGHGDCISNPSGDYCSCMTGYGGNDCSANTIEVSDEISVNVSIDPFGGVRYFLMTVPENIVVSYTDMELSATWQGTPGNAGIRMYASPYPTIPTQSAYQYVSAFPDGTSPQIIVPHADLQQPKWYFGVWNFANAPGWIVVEVDFEGWCPCTNPAQGSCLEDDPAVCTCTPQWQGASCDIAVPGSKLDGVEVGAVVAMVVIFTFLGLGCGIFIKHKRPELCESRGSRNDALVNAD